VPIFPLSIERRRLLRDLVQANHVPRPPTIEPARWTDIQDAALLILISEELRDLTDDLPPGSLTRLRAVP
jgi:hypothetical protein